MENGKLFFNESLVEIDTDHAAALVAIARSLRHIRIALGKVRQATQHSATHAGVLAKVDQALLEALTVLGPLARRRSTSLEEHRELHAIVTSGETLRTQVQTLLRYMDMAYGKGQAERGARGMRRLVSAEGSALLP